MPSTEKMFSGEEEQKAPELPRDYIEELVSALTDPIIVFPSSWQDTLPEWIKRDMPLHRLAHQMRCLKGNPPQADWDEATDLEAMAYLYPASLEHPLPYEWANIYLYLGTKVMGDRFPSDIRQEKLSDYEMGELRKLKRWIQQKKVLARKQRRKGEEPKETVPEKYEQLALQ